MNKRVVAVVLAGAMAASQLAGPVEVIAAQTSGEVETTASGTPEKVLEEGMGVDTPVEAAKDNSVETQAVVKAWLKADGKVYTVDASDTATTTEMPDLTTVTYLFVGDSVTSIPDNLFKDKVNLNTVEIKSATGSTTNTALTSIGVSAFEGTGLTNFVLPGALTSIGNSAFKNTKALETVTFTGATKLATIGNNAFEGATALLEVTGLPATLTSIGNSAFKDTTKAATVSLSGATGLTTIGTNAFENSGLTTIAIPAGVASIAANAFKGTAALKTVDLTGATALATISANAFENSGLTTVEIPATVTDIEASAFKGSSALATVTLTAATKLATIGVSAFENVTALEKPLDLSSTVVTSIGASAFKGTGVISVVLPATLLTIGDFAFQNVQNLGTVDFSAATAMTSIGTSAFEGTAISSATFPATLVTIGDSAFKGTTGLNTANFSASTGMTSIGTSAFEGSGLMALDLSAITAVVDIKEKAFKDNATLKTATLPEKTTSLKTEVFAGTALTTLEINKDSAAVDVTALPNTLETITLAGGNTNFVATDGVLYNTGSINLKVFPKAKGGEFELPASVTTIDANAAKGNTKLTSVKLASGSALKDIEASAFEDAAALKLLDLRQATKLDNVKAAAFKNSVLDLMYLGAATKDFTTTGIAAEAFSSKATTKIVKFLKDDDTEVDKTDLTTLETTWNKLTTAAGGSWTFYRVPVKPATPNAQADYNDMKLTGLTPSIGYKITVDGVETTVSSDGTGKIDIKKEWGGKTIQIASVAAGNNLESDPQSLAISGIFTVTVDGAVEDTTIATKQITKTAPKKQGYTFKTWIAEGVTLTDPTAETITFEMPSSDVTLTTKYLQDTVAPVAATDYAEMKLTALSPGADYTIETEVITADTDGKIAIKKEWSEKTISIKKNETETEAESPAQSLVISKIYTISVNEVEVAMSVEGQSVTVKAQVPEGHRFKVWTKVEGIADPSADEMGKESLTFTLLKADVKLTAEYTQIVTSKPEDMEYDGEKEVKVELDVPFDDFQDLIVNGSTLVKDQDYTVSKGPVTTLATEKTVITFTKEYLDKLTVGESTTITAVLKSGNVDFSINVVEKPTVPENPPVDFPDVNKNEWYAQAIDYVSSKEYMTGFADGKFGPADTLGRGQFASILHRMAGSPVENYNGIFSDVPDGTFYTMPVVWAHKNNVIKGYQNGKFGPSDSMTREQLVTMLYRYTQIKGGNTVARASIESFPDNAKVSGFAVEAMKWGVAEGLVSGDNGNLNPQGIASRAVGATLIQRFEMKQKPEVTPPTPDTTPPVTP